MFFAIDAVLKKKAKSPHELFLINILIFHLLLTPATLALGIGRLGLLLPPFFSGLIILFTYLRSTRTDHWFIVAHWKLALRRARLLLYGYAGTALLLGIGWLITLGMDKHSMQEIMLTVFTRIAIMPTLILVMVSAVIEAGSINQATRGELPDSLLKHYPAPDSAETLDQPAAD